MVERERWDGMLMIARFNWPFYLVASILLCLSVLGLIGLSGWMLKTGCGVAVAGCLWFLIGSLGVSHWVYDLSDLYRWKWLEGLSGRFEQPIKSIAFCHAGLDETSGALKQKFPVAVWHVLDHFDAVTMTEPSIRRARRWFPPSADTISCAYSAWQCSSATADVIFGILGIHELRSHEERVAWFREAKRCLALHGHIILVEHVRDLANFIAFGPGFLHFHSVRTWRHSWHEAGLVCEHTLRVTPFIRVFLLKSS